MNHILIIGAGRSATSLIQYMLKHSERGNWNVTVADHKQEVAAQKIGGHPRGKAVGFDVFDEILRGELIEEADVVVSLLPAHLHIHVAKDCIKYKTHLVTASYISEDMKALDEEAKAADVLLLNELGADPGIDHLTAMESIDEIREKGGEVNSFKSYCGAMVAPESMNPWGYKFTWAPRNVVLAGQGNPAIHLANGRIRYIPYNRLFSQIEKIEVPGWGSFDAYANRDSLKYRVPYGVEDVGTLFRATLRHSGFCPAWHAIVKLGLTDDTFKIENNSDMSWHDLLDIYLPDSNGKSVEERLELMLGAEGNKEVMEKLLWVGLTSNEKIELHGATPAQILQNLLMRKWKFEENDVDMIVMQHRYEYELNGEKMEKISSMVFKGAPNVDTAISMTVGIPAAIGARLILEDKISIRGVKLPLYKELYEPILAELEDFGIKFSHEERSV